MKREKDPMMRQQEAKTTDKKRTAFNRKYLRE